MQITKNKRGHWEVVGTGVNYVTLDLTGDFDGSGAWAYGWHVRVRRADGAIIQRRACHKTRNAATAEAVGLLAQ